MNYLCNHHLRVNTRILSALEYSQLGLLKDNLLPFKGIHYLNFDENLFVTYYISIPS